MQKRHPVKKPSAHTVPGEAVVRSCPAVEEAAVVVEEERKD